MPANPFDFFNRDPEKDAAKDKKAEDLKAKAEPAAAKKDESKIEVVTFPVPDPLNPDCNPGETSQARDARLEAVRRKAEQAMVHRL